MRMKIETRLDDSGKYLIRYFEGGKHPYRRLPYCPECKPTSTLLWAVKELGLKKISDMNWDWLFSGGDRVFGYTAAEAMLMVGKRLIEQKETLSHKEFESLLRSIPMSITTASNYMRCAECFSNLPAHLDFTIRNTNIKILQELAGERLSKEDLLILLKELV